jgi:flagellar basal body-associated protein FliL
MSMGDDAWGWVKRAPLPVVLALVIPVGGYLVFAQEKQGREQVKQGEQIKAMKEKDAELKADVKEANQKLDELLRLVLELAAEQKAAKPKAKEGR